MRASERMRLEAYSMASADRDELAGFQCDLIKESIANLKKIPSLEKDVAALEAQLSAYRYVPDSVYSAHRWALLVCQLLAITANHQQAEWERTKPRPPRGRPRKERKETSQDE